MKKETRCLRKTLKESRLRTNKNQPLKFKVPISTAADDIHVNTFSLFLEKIRLDISCESSARQRIHIKHQALFSSEVKSKKNKVSSAAIFIWRFKG